MNQTFNKWYKWVFFQSLITNLSFFFSLNTSCLVKSEHIWNNYNMHYFTITISIKYQANKKKLPDVITFASIWILVFYNLINFINYQFILFKVGTNHSFHSFRTYIKRSLGSCFEGELYVSIKFCTSDSMFDN